MADANVHVKRPAEVKLTLGNAPLRQYLSVIGSGRVAFVCGRGGDRRVYFLDDLSSQRCSVADGNQMSQLPVKLVESGADIAIKVGRNL